MLIRDYRRADAEAITRLFYETIRSINLRDYTEEQVRAWAPAVPDPQLWHARMRDRYTLVAEEHDEIIAFAELERDGYLDMFYCRKDVIRRGVGRALYGAVEAKAIALRLKRIFADVSITARPFFEHCGFSILFRRSGTRNGIELSNFRMDKQLSRQSSNPGQGGKI